MNKKYLDNVRKLSREPRVNAETLSDSQLSIIEGMADHVRHLESELKSALRTWFEFDTDDHELVNSKADIVLTMIEFGDASIREEDRQIIRAIETFKSAISHLCGGSFKMFAHFYALSCGHLAEFRLLKRIGRQMPQIEKVLKKRNAKNAVSMRLDQQLKQPFIDFCSSLVETGRHQGIRTLNDLLNTEGYDSAVTTVGERTIKTWAKEAGITLKAGRPKKI